MSTLLTEIKRQFQTARRNKDESTRAILSVVIGEVDTLANKAANCGKPVTDQQVIRVIQGIINSNDETIRVAEKIAPGQADPLRFENALLQEFIPKFWDVDKIKNAFTSGTTYWQEIIEAKSDGAATGVAMKYLNEQKSPVEGKTVAKAVMEIRRSIMQ